MRVWLWLNEKKTTIGAICFFAAMVMQKMAEIWLDAQTPDWAPKLIETLEWCGGIFSGVGLSHKGMKWMNQNNANATPQ